LPVNWPQPPEAHERLAQKYPVITESDVQRLESLINDLERTVKMPKEFVIPGDDPASAAMHLARGDHQEGGEACGRLAARRASAEQGGSEVPESSGGPPVYAQLVPGDGYVGMISARTSVSAELPVPDAGRWM